MDPSHSKRDQSEAWDSEDVSVEAHTARRKVLLWRRACLFLIFVVLVITAVLWQRGVMLRNEYRNALEHYAQLAEEAGLTDTEPGLLRAQWDNLDRGSFATTPTRFTLIVGNWGTPPHEGERIPLVFTNHACSLVFSKGRHVLFRDENGLHVEWMTEAEVRPITQQASRATSRSGGD